MQNRKLQAPSSKLQRNFKFQAPKVRLATCIGCLVLGVWCFFGAWSLVLGASEGAEAGYGPPTSLPSNVSVTKPSARPRQNLIDQSQAAADAKSSGCILCHRGVEPMHQASHVVLGCTDCHGGNPARGLAQEQAHVPPRHTEFWKTSPNPPNSNVCLTHESAEFIRFMNPADL